MKMPIGRRVGLFRSVHLALLFTIHSLDAGSATWKANPVNDDWNNAGNWAPATVPNGPADIATFASSSQTAVRLSENVEVAQIVFGSGADSYSITVGPAEVLTVSGVGVINGSGSRQSFILATDATNGGGTLFFTNDSSSGDSVSYTIDGTSGASAALLGFYDDSTAGKSTFVTNGPDAFLVAWGLLEFNDNSTAGGATIINSAGTQNGYWGGQTVFNDNSNAGAASITNKAATSSTGGRGSTEFKNTANASSAMFINEGSAFGGTTGGSTYFAQNSSAGSATFTINRGQPGHGGAGEVVFAERSDAGNATFRAYAGANRYFGGLVEFQGSSDGASSRIELTGSGATLDQAGYFRPRAVTVGSIEGNGLVDTAYNSFAVGSNNLDTVFSGTVTGVGSLIKVGKGRLTLTGASNYTGMNDPVAGTIIDQGTLLVNNTSGSGTGTGKVLLRRGILGGTGFIAGDVEARSAISPGKNAKSVGTLTIRSGLTMATTGSYRCTIDTGSATVDEIVANGVTIAAGAQFSPIGVGADSVALGTVLTAVSNTAATAISGMFSNLSDGSTVTVGTNTFQADYQGGDGNDLTLTAVP